MKGINRTDRLENGRALDKGKVMLYEQTPGGLRSIRCQKCKSGNAVGARTTNGTKVYRCQCGAEFTSTSM